MFRTCIGNWGVTEGNIIKIDSTLLGLVLQVSYLYLVALTNGGLAEWKLSEMLPFVPWPQFMAGLTTMQVGTCAIGYK